jgi:YNFM family putative membrane transporter
VLTLPDVLLLLVLGLACMAAAMFAGVTAVQLGVGDVARTDRGAANALYFSIYYAAGALGAYVPGLAWQRWGWNGVAIVSLAALGVASAGIALARAARESTP